jgi:ABC-2 type transport system ATP-binding protein
MLEIKDLTKIYGTQHAVDNITFTVNKGEIAGFLGPNGAGKSTTMKMATCFIPPTSGTIKVGDYDVVEQSMEVRKLVGYLPEHNPLYLDMYVHEYLQFVGSLYDIKGAKLKSAVIDAVDRVGLQIEQNKKIGALSKGYRQRVGLASALLHDPQVLILDEPTTGLDPNQIVEIRQVIKNIGKEKTVVFSSHIMQEVQAICDRVIIINRGKIVADGTLSELKKENKEGQLLTISFAEAINEQLFKGLKGLVYFKNVGNNTYEIKASPKADLRAPLLEIVAAEKLNLLSLAQKENSLESIFQELTQAK